VISKTPKFDGAISLILDGLKPGSRQCSQCQANFKVLTEDIDFYRSFQVPAPKFCPTCRHQRRVAFRVRTPRFYKKSCSAPEHSEKTISFFAEDNPVKVYDFDYWWSDAWDPVGLGVEYDVAGSFFDQFKKLFDTIPQQPLFRDPKSVNCDYTVSGVISKNCYFVGTPYFSEDIYYGFLPIRSKNCIDITNVAQSEFCYESIELERCFNCNFCFRSEDCLDSWFLFDSKNCSNCFMSTNLRNKRFCFLNEQFSESEYKRRLAEINLGSHREIEKYRRIFDDLVAKAIHKHVDVQKSERILGDKIRNTKDGHWVFNSLGESQNIRYAYYFDRMSDSMDVSGSTACSRIYDSTGIIGAENIKFGIGHRTGIGLEYSAYCNNCENCFGCVGLRNKKFCIFNQQYSESEYWLRLDEIKLTMLEAGEYGEFFPMRTSPHPYNDSDAQIEYPLTREEAEAIGAWWQDAPEEGRNIGDKEVLAGEAIPDDIAGVSDDILSKAIQCEVTGKPFLIIKPELEFYRKKGLPLPRIHPLERIIARFRKIYPNNLWPTKCAKCTKDMWSAHDPEKRYQVYCENCYNSEIV
jgi:hypothetical protein